MLDSIWDAARLKDPDSLENRDLRFIKRWTGFCDNFLTPYHRGEVRGLERIPRQEGLVYVGNHNGFPYMTELWLFLSALFNEYGMSRYPYILGHKVSLSLPFVNNFLTAVGVIGAKGQNAARVLERGTPLMVYAGADAELMRPYRDRTRLRFKGRTSYIRFALKHNVPIVPIASVGGHSTSMILDDLPWLAEAIGAKSRLGIHAWPLMLSIPWGLTLGPAVPPYIPWPSKIIVETLEPMVWKRSAAGAYGEDRIAECAAQIEQAIESALLRLEAERLAHERSPLDVIKEAVLKALQWIQPHLADLARWLETAGSRLVELSGRGQEQRAARDTAKVEPQLRRDIQHDVDLFRRMAEEAGRTGQKQRARRRRGAVSGEEPPPRKGRRRAAERIEGSP